MALSWSDVTASFTANTQQNPRAAQGSFLRAFAPANSPHPAPPFEAARSGRWMEDSQLSALQRRDLASCG